MNWKKISTPFLAMRGLEDCLLAGLRSSFTPSRATTVGRPMLSTVGPTTVGWALGGHYIINERRTITVDRALDKF